MEIIFSTIPHVSDSESACSILPITISVRIVSLSLPISIKKIGCNSIIPSHFSSRENRIYFSVKSSSGTPMCLSPLRKKEKLMRSVFCEKFLRRSSFLLSPFFIILFSRLQRSSLSWMSISHSFRFVGITPSRFPTTLLCGTTFS